MIIYNSNKNIKRTLWNWPVIVAYKGFDLNI